MNCQPLDMCDCNKSGSHLCKRSVDAEQMSVVKVAGRTMTTAECPVCTLPMWRTGGAVKTVQDFKSAADYRTDFGPLAFFQSTPSFNTFCNSAGAEEERISSCPEFVQ